jgi:hypothetical protein
VASKEYFAQLYAKTYNINRIQHKKARIRKETSLREFARRKMLKLQLFQNLSALAEKNFSWMFARYQIARLIQLSKKLQNANSSVTTAMPNYITPLRT